DREVCPPARRSDAPGSAASGHGTVQPSISYTPRRSTPVTRHLARSLRKLDRFAVACAGACGWHAGCAGEQTMRFDLSRTSRVFLAVVAAGALAALLIVGLIATTVVDLARFHRADVRRSTIVYAAPLELRPGVHVGLVDLAGALSRLAYRETTTPTGPGQY